MTTGKPCSNFIEHSKSIRNGSFYDSILLHGTLEDIDIIHVLAALF